MSGDRDKNWAGSTAQDDWSPSPGLSTASGLAALLTAVFVVWLATGLQVRGSGWLPWTVLALTPAAAGALSVSRRTSNTTVPAAVFGSCTAVVGLTVQIQPGHGAAVAAAATLTDISACIGAVAAGLLVLRSIRATRRNRGAHLALWSAAAVAFTALSIPSPTYFPPGPIETIFAGDSGGQRAAAFVGLMLLALPLLAAGPAPARTSAAVLAGWLPVTGGQLLGWLIFRLSSAQVDLWYYLSWLVWLAIAVLALAEARAWRIAGTGVPQATVSG